MDNKKNLIFALILSIVVITLYQLLFIPKQSAVRPSADPGNTVDRSEPAAKEQEGEPITPRRSALEDLGDRETPPEPSPLTAVNEDARGEQEREIRVETGLYTAVFSNKGAALHSFVLEKYLDDAKPEKRLLDLVSRESRVTGLYPFHLFDRDHLELFRDINLSLFQIDSPTRLEVRDGEQKKITFLFADTDRNLLVRKTFTFTGGSYVVELDHEIRYQNRPIPVSMVYGPRLGNNLREVGRGIEQTYEIGSFNGQDASTDKLSKFLRNVNRDNLTPTEDNPFTFSSLQPISNSRNSYWVAYSRNYFTALFKTDYAQSNTRLFFISEYVDAETTNIYFYLTIQNPQALYLGPKDASILKENGQRHDFQKPSEVISLGWFGFISKLLRDGINMIYHVIPNYGWAIVLLTIFLRIILFPLTYTSSKSMARMQTLQPKLKAIKKKYKNYKRDPEQRKQMNAETMELYRKEKVNPASGCFPMLLQMPILFGFFTLLRTTIEVRHEPWILWIQDLSLKDPLYILPISMGITQIAVQKLSPTSADANQKKMAYIMPVFFVLICLSLPSGLTLYWFISNLLMIVQQKITNNLISRKKKAEEQQRKKLKRKRG
jgi:YidC/Oxa1 family membrane protein insertase